MLRIDAISSSGVAPTMQLRGIAGDISRGRCCTSSNLRLFEGKSSRRTPKGSIMAALHRPSGVDVSSLLLERYPTTEVAFDMIHPIVEVDWLPLMESRRG